MIKRSLNTYMNAWTSSDNTSYPFSTQNAQDYYNLMHVYLDATLNPKLNETDFNQEGFRIEVIEEEGKKKLEYKGIVYNEMIGALSNSNDYFSQKVEEATYPETCYSFNSGGDPNEIVNLKYQDLLEFHKNYYHPTNSRIITYGNFPVEENFKIIDEYFDKFDEKNKIMINTAKKYNKPQRFFIKGPPGIINLYYKIDAIENEFMTKLSISYLTVDQKDSFDFSYLSSLLIDEPRGIFYKNLIESKLAPDFVQTGYQNSYK
jgi:Zn-dependent M16 (insulinase) family peptidase